ncbi:early nodulin-like protein 18 [Populus nigra]|uniref:early nodulin-like protein 18 n=1 Tax=Populus nigra TaxID=3691 RepID=UPI002B26EC41|nr:early nodulin-like protein 18 [Populus nigra]
MIGATILHLITMAVLITAAATQAPPTKYINHTVGDNAGWFFNFTTNTTATNYSSWAASQTFNLGDYLIFKTSSNQMVIQTYNLSTFKNCSIDDSSYNDTFVYNGGNTVFNQTLNIIVPLTIQGPNYFFSDASDGIQCQHGLAFDINVSRSLGLPPSLNQPLPPPYREPPSPDSAYPPITIPAKGEGAGNSGFKNGASVQVIACVSLFALLAVNGGDRGGIF